MITIYKTILRSLSYVERGLALFFLNVGRYSLKFSIVVALLIFAGACQGHGTNESKPGYLPIDLTTIDVKVVPHGGSTYICTLSQTEFVVGSCRTFQWQDCSESSVCWPDIQYIRPEYHTDGSAQWCGGFDDWHVCTVEAAGHSEMAAIKFAHGVRCQEKDTGEWREILWQDLNYVEVQW